jgi:hypothetical protein
LTEILGCRFDPRRQREAAVVPEAMPGRKAARQDRCVRRAGQRRVDDGCLKSDPRLASASIAGVAASDIRNTRRGPPEACRS